MAMCINKNSMIKRVNDTYMILVTEEIKFFFCILFTNYVLKPRTYLLLKEEICFIDNMLNIKF